MRSRYCAYVLRLGDYLMATWYPGTAPGELELAPLKWLGLEVRHSEQSGDAGVVEFVARCVSTAARSACMRSAALCAKAAAGITSTGNCQSKRFYRP